MNVGRLNIENICPINQLVKDENGVPLNYDEDYYDFSSSRWVVKMFSDYLLYYVSNVSNSSQISPISLNETVVDLSDSFNESDFSSYHHWPPNNIPLVLDMLQNTEKDKLVNGFKDVLNKLNPRENVHFSKKIIFQTVLTVSAYFVIILVSLFGNSLVLFIILSRRHLRSQTTNRLIANLTLSDFLLTTLNIPLTIVRLLFDSWPLGSTFCYLGPLVQALSVYVSTISMVVISIDRYHVLLGSLPTRLSSTLPSIWTIVVIWLLSAIFSIPHFIFNRVVHKQTYTCVKRCEAIYPKPALTYSRFITLFTVLSQYIIPLSIIIFCYSQIGIHIWKRVGIGAMTSLQKDSHLKSKRRTIKMLILVVIVFAICWLPLNLYHLYLDFFPNSLYSKSIFTACHWFGISSVCYNPFIYFWLNKQYKERARAILRICHKWTCCKNRVSMESDKTDSSSSYDNIAEKKNTNVYDPKEIFILKDLSEDVGKKCASRIKGCTSGNMLINCPNNREGQICLCSKAVNSVTSIPDPGRQAQESQKSCMRYLSNLIAVEKSFESSPQTSSTMITVHSAVQSACQLNTFT